MGCISERPRLLLGRRRNTAVPQVLFSETGHVTAAAPPTRQRKRPRERPYLHVLAAGSVLLAPEACSAYRRSPPSSPKAAPPETPLSANAWDHPTACTCRRTPYSVELKMAKPEAGGRQQKAPCCRCSTNTSWQRRGREGICCAVCSPAATRVNIETHS